MITEILNDTFELVWIEFNLTLYDLNLKRRFINHRVPCNFHADRVQCVTGKTSLSSIVYYLKGYGSKNLIFPVTEEDMLRHVRWRTKESCYPHHLVL